MPQAKSRIKKDVAVACASRARRNPEKTRQVILDVAGRMMAADGPKGLSVSKVAQEAGVNRGTAYHHFQTREQLIAASIEHVSQRLYGEVFLHQASGHSANPRDLIEKLANFAIENPEFGPTWLKCMIRDRSALNKDPFWNGMVGSLRDFSNTVRAQPNIDIEVYAMTVLTSLFTWPLWVEAHRKSSRQRKRLVRRYITETLRLATNGVFHAGAMENN